MIKINKPENCCGCEACVQKCPKSCIVMAEDREGFLYPQINKEDCIDCGLCERVCPLLHVPPPCRPLAIKGAWRLNNRMRLLGSSGGLFSAIAEQIISQDGIVFGAAFDTEWNLRHIGVETSDDLIPLLGSKYLQSSSSGSFRHVAEVLAAGRQVLYCGTPCQIFALKSFLGGNQNKLLTVDFVCHGVSNHKIWNMYLNEFLGKFGKKPSDLSKYSFRDKSASDWMHFRTSFQFKGEDRIHYITPNQDWYMVAFRDLALRPSCYACKFKGHRSGSDFTLGDFWGINQLNPKSDVKDGCSVVFLNTPHALDFWRNSEKLVNSFDASCSDVLKYNPMLLFSVRKHWNRKRFFSELTDDCSFSELVKREYYTISLSGKLYQKGIQLLRKAGIIRY